MSVQTEQVPESPPPQSSAAESRDDLLADVPAGDVTRRTVQGAAFTFAAQITRFGIRLLSTAVLARLLDQSDFGLLMMVFAVVEFIKLFKDAGLSQAVVQSEKITDAQVSALFWVNLLISIALAGVTAAMAPRGGLVLR